MRALLPIALLSVATLTALAAPPPQSPTSAPKPSTTSSPSASSTAPAAERYVFSYFVKNGEDGMHLAASPDGLRWSPLNGGRPVLTSTLATGLMRDPCVLRGPDGRFHVVWTTGWWDRVIGISHSTDLVTWSAPRAIPVMMHEPNAVNAWAPEIAYDAATKDYVIFWSTTIKGKFGETEMSGDVSKEVGVRLNHRIYATATKDFESYTPTRLFYDGGFNVIDATIVEDAPNRRFVMILKDETKNPVAKKHLRVATAATLQGPYGAASAPITVDWVEGPTLLRVGGDWMLYYDEYTRKQYGASRSTDLKTWTVLPDAAGLHFPADARHGTAFTAPAYLVDALAARISTK